MKTFKPRFIVLSLVFLIINGCVVKSLFPFYTLNSIYFENKIIGDWKDANNDNWDVLPYQEAFLKESEKKNSTELNDDELDLFNKYKKGYIVYLEKDSTTTLFLAIPFKINNQLFLDFTPIENKESDGFNDNNMYKMHLIETHTLAKVDIISPNEISVKWFSSEKLEELLKENKIKIKHEKVGFNETTLLTASSDELEKFIKKYMNSKDEDKWKTDIEFNLIRVDEK
ncbi:MAG: hypothetical protein KAJ28_02855 [Flavobacteriaceae bacterium]|nr:hypothetical protein [Flavobacteriaceae bacterium]